MDTLLRQRLFGQFRFWFWGLLIGLVILNLLYKWSLATSYAPDLGGFERNVILGIQQVMLGKGLYSRPDAVPFFIIQYMPLYYHLVAAMGNLFHINPWDAHAVYQLARGFNLLLVLGSCGLLFASARQHFNLSIKLALPVSFLALLWMEKFTLSGRPDSLKAFLFQLLVFILLSFPERRKRWVFPLATLVGFMAFATKQDGLVFLGILPLSLVFSGRWKESLVWGLVTLVGLALMVSFFTSLPGSFFLENVAGGLQNGISISWFVGAFGNYFGLRALLFGLALVLGLEFAFAKNHKLRVLAAAFACSFFPALLFSLKYGSGPNYFLECTLVSLLILGVWLKTFPLKWAWVWQESHWLLAFMFLGLSFLVPAIHWTTEVFFHQEARLEQSYLAAKQLAQQLRKAAGKGPGRILVDDSRQWEDNLSTLMPDILVAGQRDVIVQVANALGKNHHKYLRQYLSSGAVDFIVTDAGQSPNFLGADYSKYQQKLAFGNFWVWESRMRKKENGD